ncbi:MAG: TDP-N-acetylfucosamine:lipid II N-acetylfucosaminyltransferase [Bacteroidota bacterium]|nr:TDP-N-acetylfucosamine:lipid II N-acetylfucosaminyltransferase [Bacteroidota bacterium]
MKILHCLYDDKFTDGTIRTYNCDSRHTNKYIVIDDRKVISSFKYIKCPDVTCLPSADFLKLAKEYDVVVLHSLQCMSLESIRRIPPVCRVIWYAWGFDFYCGGNPIVKINLYQAHTKKFFLLDIVLNHFRRILLYPRVQLERLSIRRALCRVDYFSGVFPYEYNLLKQSRPYIHAKPLDFYYGDVDFFVKDNVDYNIDRNRRDIILGNSGDPSNNHLDALLILKEVGIPKDSRIIIPLNYGSNPNYKKWITKKATTLFPNNVLILDHFLPLKDYLQLVSTCKVAIFNHERQQASDNILMQLMYGAKVYMPETSQAYHYLKRVGFRVFSLQKDIDGLMSGLSDDDIINNRMLLSKLYSSHTIVDRIKTINDIVSDDIIRHRKYV